MKSPPKTPALSPIVAGLWRLHEWKLSTSALAAWVEKAIELGVTSFDHADIYGGYTNEALFGQALRSSPGLRARLKIVTKCGIKLMSLARPTHQVKSYDSSREHVLASVDASLRALQTDHIDVLLMHRPDFLMDPEELALTFEVLRKAGKVLAFGVSNHSPAQVAMLHRHVPLVTNQIELSPLRMQALVDGSLDQCLDLGLQPMIWSPLARGRLFTRNDEQATRVRAALCEMAPRYLDTRSGGKVSLATLAYAWILRHPSRPLPITGSQRIEALREAVAALTIQMSSDDWYRLWQASMGHEVA